MFHFSDAFIKEYLPQTIELGRSFVTLEYQSTRAGSKGLFALDNLWDGLGAPHGRGGVWNAVRKGRGTLTQPPPGRPQFSPYSKKNFNNGEKLFTPREDPIIETTDGEVRKLFSERTLLKRIIRY